MRTGYRRFRATLEGTALALALVGAAAAGAQERAPAVRETGERVSIAAIMKTLEAIDFDRTSGTDGERKAAAALAARLSEHGVRHVVHDVRAFLSWPRRAELVGSDGFRPRAIAPAFGGSTPEEGIAADVLILPEDLPAESPLGSDARGRIVVAWGMISPESALRAERAGAAGLVHVNDTAILHEMIATTVWGTPTPDSAGRVPALPIVSIARADGEALRTAARAGGDTYRLRLVARVDRAWSTIPLVVAEVPGATPDFILVATHLDAWYRGMTDTGGTVASIVEMARVLQTQQASLTRGVRFAWWPGHSFGRYAGSAWYADRFWEELDRHCVAYTNLDGAGRRGSRLDSVSAGGWPGIAEFSREFAARLTGKPMPPAADRLFRPGRDSDSSFQGIGVPEFSIGVPGPPRGHQDVTPSGRIAYWHTAEDTIDKIDARALELDTRYRVAQIFELATAPVLPLRIEPIAASYVRALDELARAGTFDLAPARDAAAALARAAARLDAAPRPSSAEGAARLDALLVRLTHRLNSTLYTKAGRFEPDPAAPIPILPLLAGVRELSSLAPESDERGFLETALVRGRNAVRSTIVEATDAIEQYLRSPAS
jgi:Iap family predicted aminopeptidase